MTKKTKRFCQNEVYWTSDLHLWHRNLFEKFRSFETIEQMHETIISNWNNTVEYCNHVFILGDVTFAGHEKTDPILSRLNGILHLINGNHDKALKGPLSRHFNTRQDYLEIDVDDQDVNGGKQRIVMSHFPFRSWNRHHYGSWHVHGHSHGSMERLGKSYDVGVDCNSFTPVSYSKLKSVLSKCDIHCNDHHELMK